jgi:hypothetical protein
VTLHGVFSDFSCHNISVKGSKWEIWFYVLVWFMVFNATFNNISVILWWSVLLVEEIGIPGENCWPVASHWQTLSHKSGFNPIVHECVLVHERVSIVVHITSDLVLLYLECKKGLGLWLIRPLSTLFQLYRGGQFIGSGNWRTLWKPPTCHKSLTNLIT